MTPPKVGELWEYESGRGEWHDVLITAVNERRFHYRNVAFLAGGIADIGDPVFRPVTEERLVARFCTDVPRTPHDQHNPEKHGT